MLVVLRENIENLGRIGDAVKVSDGYARNYLLPRNLVVKADENNISEINHHKKSLEKKRLAEIASASELAEKLKDFSCTIKRKVGAHDKLFGSVSVNDIADSLKQSGFSISKNQIHLEKPIKSLGVHSISVKLAPEVEAPVKVWVVKEEGV